MHACLLSHIQIFATPWTVALQAFLSTGFFRQEYWSGLPCLPPGDVPDPGIKPMSPAFSVLKAFFFQLLSLYLCLNSLVCTTKINVFNCVAIHSNIYSSKRVHAQSCPTHCDPMDCSLSGSSLHGISQARILEWVAISYTRGSSQPRDRTCISGISCIGRQILYH